MAYLNWRGPQGRETVDQLARSDNKSYRAELRRLITMSGMAVYSSSRACNGWNV